MWLTRCSFLVNDLEQKPHRCGDSPVCWRTWFSRCSFRVNVFEQKSQRCGVSPVCHIMWFVKCSFLVNDLPAYGRGRAGGRHRDGTERNRETGELQLYWPGCADRRNNKIHVSSMRDGTRRDTHANDWDDSETIAPSIRDNYYGGRNRAGDRRHDTPGSCYYVLHRRVTLRTALPSFRRTTRLSQKSSRKSSD